MVTGLTQRQQQVYDAMMAMGKYDPQLRGVLVRTTYGRVANKLGMSTDAIHRAVVVLIEGCYVVRVVNYPGQVSSRRYLLPLQGSTHHNGQLVLRSKGYCDNHGRISNGKRVFVDEPRLLDVIKQCSRYSQRHGMRVVDCGFQVMGEKYNELYGLWPSVSNLRRCLKVLVQKSYLVELIMNSGGRRSNVYGIAGTDAVPGLGMGMVRRELRGKIVRLVESHEPQAAVDQDEFMVARIQLRRAYKEHAELMERLNQHEDKIAQLVDRLRQLKLKQAPAGYKSLP